MDSCLKLQLAGDPEQVLQLLVRLRKPEKVPPHCSVVTQFGDIITCRVKRRHLLDLYNSAETWSVKAARIIPALSQEDKSKASRPVMAKPSRSVQALYTGKGIFFASVDWGFDFAHKNLRGSDGNTRFSCIWDQGGIYDGNKYGYGCMYTENEINEALATDTPYQTLGYHPGRTDFLGQGMHGTHVLDIATGSRIIGEGGIAPGATIVGVQLGNSLVNGSDLALGDSVKLVEALDFIHHATKEAPCVINMSLGSHGDSHTGKSLVEIAFDNFLLEHPGYALVQSVGNYYQANCHIHHTIGQGQEYAIEWNIPHRNRAPNEVEIWYPHEDEFGVTLIAPDGEIVADINPFEDIRISYRGDPIGYVLHRKREPNTELNHIDIILDVTILTDKWIIKLTGKQVLNGNFHAFCERNDLSQSRFSSHQSTPFTTTGSVCNGKQTITVGAYDHNDPEQKVVQFSSSGPTVLGKSKPDLLAPGFRITAARSAPPTAYDATNDLTVKSGSSMAAPHVSGAILLLFEKYLPQRLPISTVKELIQNSLTALPNHYTDTDLTRAGSGILDIAQLITDKKSPMPLLYITSPTIEDEIDEESIYDVLHSEDLPEETPYPETGGDESAEGQYETILSEWTETFDSVDPFTAYRHFHPHYAFSLPYDISVIPVALPGTVIRPNLQAGDLLVHRDVLTNRTNTGVVVVPQWMDRNDMNGMAHLFPKPGWYIKVFGDFSGKGNELTYVPAARTNKRLADNIIILRKNNGTNVANTGESQALLFESGDDALVPALLGNEKDPPAETLYVRIDLGLRKECSRLDDKTYACISNLKYDVEAKTGIFIPATATAKPAIDILLYLHGHKSGYVKSGKDLPIDALWNRNQIPAFAFRELLNESGKDMILVAPTLGPLSQAGSLLTNKGFTQFIDQVLVAIAQYSTLYKGKEPPQIQNIIMAAHSGGGIRMRSIAQLASSNLYAGLVKECWGFDCTYTKDDPQVWHDWAAAHPDKTVYFYSIVGTKTALLSDKLNTPGLILPNIHSLHAATSEHNRVPSIHMRERLTGKAANVTPGKSSKPPKDVLTNSVLKGPVGKGGQNQSDDVVKVQSLLNNAGIAIPITGNVATNEGDVTVLAIFHYQKRKKLPSYDGRVDPNGATLKSLLQYAGNNKPSPPPAPTPPVPVPPTPPLPTDPVLEAELLTHPAIQARYKTTREYKKIRDKVTRWKKGKPPIPIGDPAGYMEEALQQWNAHPEIHRHFGNNFDRDDHRSYLNLKRLYEAKGVNNPASYFKDNIVSVQFFNQSTSAHKELAAALKHAQASLEAGGHNCLLKSAGSFVPRTVNFNIDQLSDHAMGKAIDINSASNPHIRDKREVKVINALCKAVLPNGLLKESDPEVLRQASTHFQQTFNDDWVAQQTDTELTTILSNSEVRQRLKGFAKDGFLTLSTTLIRGLQSAGLQWGGSWNSAKDFMHFQVPGT
jgi:subtilisin family serine protease